MNNICFVIGILLNPFIMVYHAQQRRTLSKLLFLTISSIDQFRLLYTPLMLIPKLLSSLEDKDYYIIYNPTSVPWTADLNFFLRHFLRSEMDALVMLNISRYFSIVHPLSSFRGKYVIFFVASLMALLRRILSPILARVFQTEKFYLRITDALDHPAHEGLLRYIMISWTFLSLVIGVIFVALTTHHLKKTDTASSDVSSRNVKRSIIFLIATSLFNIFLLITGINYQVIETMKTYNDVYKSTRWDCSTFVITWVLPLSQSVFNSVSFLLISRLFREFVRRSVRERRIASM